MTSKPKDITPSIICKHCGNKAPMEIVSQYSRVELNNEDDHPPWEEGDVYELLLCPSCDKVILRKYYFHEMFMDDDDNTPTIEVLYPLEFKMPSGLPDVIQTSYQAALKVRTIDTNAYAVLLGRVLDKVCADRKATGDSLYDKFENLSSRGEIPKQLVEMAHSLRQLRNVGAHADLGELTEREVPFLDDLCRAILEYVYGAPLLLQKAKNRLNELKIAAE